MMMKEEIWLLLDSRSIGGIETHVLQLAAGIRLEGHRVRVVFVNDYGPHPMKTDCARSRLDTLSLDGSVKGLIQALRLHSPSLVHTHGYKAGIFGRLAGCITRIPTYSTYHAGEPGRGRVAVYDWLDRHSAWLARGVFAVSQQIASRVAANCQVLDNFVETSNLMRSSGQQIAFVGRLSAEKGADRFLQIARRFPGQRFHLYGEGPLYDPLCGDAGDNVIFHGRQPMDKYWPEIGLLLMPSRHEGLPMAALEAMARGIPLVASHVGALPQLILDRQYGWLVEQEDIEGFAKGVYQWLTLTAQQRESLSSMVSCRIQERFSTRAVVPQILKHYAV